MSESIDDIKNRLIKYTEKDIKFLKSQWQQWIKEKKFDLIEQKTGANIQAVYDIFNPSKIKNIEPAKYSPDRYEIRLHHGARFEIVVIILFDKPEKGDLGIVTYYKRLISN